MWARAFRLLGLVVVSVFAGYLIGNFMQSEGLLPPPASGFVVTNLCIQPAEVQPDEIVTITVSVANTHDTWVLCDLALYINDVKETEGRVMVAAGSSQDISFNVTREVPDRYSVFTFRVRDIPVNQMAIELAYFYMG